MFFLNEIIFFSRFKWLIQTGKKIKMDYNCHGRLYKKGKSLSMDIRQLVIEDLLRRGASNVTGFVPRGAKALTAERYCVSERFVRKMWKQFSTTGDVTIQISGGTELRKEQLRKLTDEDVDYIHSLKIMDPCMYNHEVKEKLLQYSNNPELANGVSISTIQRTTRHRLPGGLRTWKKVNKSAKKRWAPHNILYTEVLFARLRYIDPRTVYFIDECGVSIENGKRQYGQSIVNTRAVSITEHTAGVNYTVILLVGLESCVYAEVTPENVDGGRFAQFMINAKNAHQDDGRPFLPDGSLVVLDNAGIHTSLANTVIRPYLQNFDITYIFMPTYSPDMSPAEPCFMKLKKLIKTERYKDLLQEDIQTCILMALSEITPQDVVGFYGKVPFNYLGM